MLYELHLTVRNNPEVDPNYWVNVCDGLGVKPLHIELLGGFPRNPYQLMTAATHEGHDASAYAWRHDLIGELAFQGFNVIRAKLEVPLDKSIDYVDPRYHEAHVKALVPKDKHGAVIKRGQATGWLTSQNLLYKDVDGRDKLYFTKRLGGVHYREAGTRFAAAFGHLQRIMPWAVRMEMETVVVDNNPGLDEGWA